MKIEPRQLLQIAAIVETGSFAQAAAMLDTSQPAISRDIAAIEARVGMPLFDRSVRPAQPTELCLSLAEDGSAILFARRQAALKLDRARSGTSGTIRLVGPPMFTDHVITPMFASFHARHPAVEIHSRPGYVDEALSLLRARKVDIAIAAVERLDEVDMTFHALQQSRNVIACRLNHPLRRQPDTDLQALLDFGWVAPPEGSPLGADLAAALATLDAPAAAVRFRTATAAGIRSYLENTDCLAILPLRVVQVMSRNYDIVALPFDLPGPTRTVGMVVSQVQPETRLVRRMRQHLSHEFK
ncbi:MAG: LysR family transcriptional regulator [Shimia sp.]|nr:LysR family transcriptional regulator [Shimia sp.]